MKNYFVRFWLSAIFLAGFCSACSNQSEKSLYQYPQKYLSVSFRSESAGIPAFYTPPEKLSGLPHGTLLRYQLVTGLPGLPAGTKIYRILFTSETIYGSQIPESGYVAVPPNPPGKSGYPIMSWAHGTTGTAQICAPSLFKYLYLTPDISLYLNAGYLIAATDYQGLGVPGLVHPYSVGKSEGYGVLDAALAARELPGIKVSKNLLIYGHSQGGQAALFAGQLAPIYAPRLNLLGVVAAAPGTQLDLIIKIADGPLGKAIEGFTVSAAYTWSETYKNLPPSSIFTPTGLSFAQKYVPRVCEYQLFNLLSNYLPTQIFKGNVSNNSALISDAHENDPGLVPTNAPILVIQGSADTTVPEPLTTGFVENYACKVHDNVNYIIVNGATHGTVVQLGASNILNFLNSRLEGLPQASVCPSYSPS